jgi:prepilin-type processing-associated H-X9-DG protein
MSEMTNKRLSRIAVGAFMLGVSSLVLSLAAAVPALFLGIHAIRTIHRADGRLGGLRLAIAGLVLAAFATLVTLVGSSVLALVFVQEKAREAGCTNNLRQLGEAIQRYHDHHDKQFPPGTVLIPSLPPEKRLSWEAAIVPFLVERGPAGKKDEKLADEIAFKEAWDAPANAGLRQNVAPFLCPTFARALASDQVGLTSYVGVAGVGREAARLPLTDPNAGFYGFDRLLRASDISASLSATMTAIETTQTNGPWAAGGTPTVRGLEPDCTRYVGAGAAFGGLHRAGANVLWADGAVHLVSDKIDPYLFQLQARIVR